MKSSTAGHSGAAHRVRSVLLLSLVMVFAACAGQGAASRPNALAAAPRPDSCPPIGDELDSMGLPVYKAERVDVKARLPMNGYMIPPRHPMVEGGMVVTFVIDETGRTDMRTIRVIRSDHEKITETVRRYLAQVSWAPALLRGCPVRTRVQQEFNFKRR